MLIDMNPKGLDFDGIDLRGRTLAQIEEIVIRESFERNHGHRERMCADLGIGRSTLLRKLDRLGLRKPRMYVKGHP